MPIRYTKYVTQAGVTTIVYDHVTNFWIPPEDDNRMYQEFLLAPPEEVETVVEG